jgi:hypothetical protein
MTYDQVINHFGSLTKAAQALGLAKQNVHNWGARGRIPFKWQIKLAGMSGGALKADAAAKSVAMDLASYLRVNGKARGKVNGKARGA